MIHTIKQERLYQKKVNSSLVLLVTVKWAIQIKCLFVRFCMLNVVCYFFKFALFFVSRKETSKQKNSIEKNRVIKKL